MQILVTKRSAEAQQAADWGQLCTLNVLEQVHLHSISGDKHKNKIANSLIAKDRSMQPCNNYADVHIL